MKSFILSVLSAGLILSCSTHYEPVEYVNPFIGTAAHGHTFPGASAPFGLVQLSPETRTSGWDACSGYHYSDSVIIGFSHTHLSGTGCADLKDILFYPSYNVKIDGNRIENFIPYRFYHEKETAKCGYYAVSLESGIDVKLTAGKRVGMHQYTFKNDGIRRLLIDLAYTADEDTLIASKIYKLSENEICGERETSGWVKHQKIYFYAKSSTPFLNVEFLADKYALLSFGNNIDTLVVGVGLSATSIEEAKANYYAETNAASSQDFDKLKASTWQEWNNILKKFDIKGGTDKEKTIFYTAVYHAFLTPNIISDSSKKPYYSTISLWDTFRTWYPLMTLIDKDIVNETIRSMLSMYVKNGELPIWPLWNGETRTMIGYHAVPVIADAYLKGIRDYDASLALEAMIRSSNINKKGSDYYIKYGYVPCDKLSESVSITLEYAYDDWCIARMAESMGRKDVADEYYKRSENYKNLFDPSTRFFRPKNSDGRWKTPFDPTATSAEYTEATPWQYRFFVPHDIKGLIRLFGSENKFEAALDSLFSYENDSKKIEIEDVTGLMGQYAHGNEPGHNYPYLFNYIGKQNKTASTVKKLLDEMYTASPDGIAGNEDCGQMSAWYIMSAMGLYPVCPASGKFMLSSPLFKEMKITLSNGKILIIKSNSSKRKPYLKTIKLNRKSLERNYVLYDELSEGGVLEFEFTDSKSAM